MTRLTEKQPESGILGPLCCRTPRLSRKIITLSRKIRTAAFFAALVLLQVACSNSTPESASVLNRSLGPEPESLDVHVARTTQAAIVLRDIGEGLTGYSPSGELTPAAAKSWEVSDDGLEYRFQLQPDARWSNGEPVTADHFVYSFRRLVDPATAAPYSEFLVDVVNAANIVSGAAKPESLGVHAEGDHELIFRLERPVSYFLNLLTHNSTFPVYPDSIAEFSEMFARPGRLVSNGAYKLDSWDIGAMISVSRNEYYWNNANTSIDRVRHHVTAEPMSEINRYRAGELDITETVAAGMFAGLLEEIPDEVRVAPLLNVYYYGLNLTKPPFKDNPKLRQALSMAIDRELITSYVTKRGEQPAYGWVPADVQNYGAMRFDYAEMNSDERHATARRLYAESGYGEDRPLVVELRYNTSETHERIAVAVKAMWKEVLGFDATLINEEFQVLLAHMQAREITQAFRSSWSGDYNDASAFLSVMESSNPNNLAGYSNSEFDSLMKRAADQTDPTHRQLFLEEAERMLLADHPVIPLYFYVSKHLVSKRINGWQDNVLDYHYSQHLSFKPVH